VIALILGGAPSVWRELAEAQALLNRRHMVVAANRAGIHWAGKLDGWATLHPDLLAGWGREREGNKDFRAFIAEAHVSSPRAEVVSERWPGSSGLYALQVALFEMNATAAILCGVPMETTAGHFAKEGAWAGTADYRQAFATALPTVGGRVRSMGGWTAELFGKPTAEWVGAVDNITPLGGSAPPDARNDVMHHVKNGSESTLSFWHRQEDGLQGRVHLAPGEAGDFEVDRNAPELQRKGVTITTPRAPAPKTAAARKSAPRKAAASKPTKPAPPAPPVSDEA
jgi:hypothetical protein